ncbi:MAG: hypothetical protein EOM50_02710 [Erysipelotrichia bacterium]|nr:hypothetical protein [Erysipelotrichia bacterium]
MNKAYKRPYLQVAIILFLGMLFGLLLNNVMPNFKTVYLVVFMQIIVFCIDTLLFIFCFPLYLRLGITKLVNAK